MKGTTFLQGWRTVKLTYTKAEYKSAEALLLEIPSARNVTPLKALSLG